MFVTKSNGEGEEELSRKRSVSGISPAGLTALWGHPSQRPAELQFSVNLSETLVSCGGNHSENSFFRKGEISSQRHLHCSHTQPCPVHDTKKMLTHGQTNKIRVRMRYLSLTCNSRWILWSTEGVAVDERVESRSIKPVYFGSVCDEHRFLSRL